VPKYGMTIDERDLVTLYKRLNSVEKELRADINGELRTAANRCATRLIDALRQSASAAPTPQARVVAGMIEVKRDRIPVVRVGGSKAFRAKRSRGDQPRVGALLWGSERGGAKFKAAPGGSYWIKPAVDRFVNGAAYQDFYRAVTDILRREDLL